MTVGEAAAPIAGGTSITMPLAALVAGQVVQDGEIIQMLLKPSRWFILFNSLRFAGTVIALVIGVLLYDGRFIGRPNAAAQVAIFLISARVMLSVLQWMGRYYILTDLRVIRLSGVLTPEIYSCPLRKVADTRCVRTFRERLVGIGSIVMVSSDSDVSGWQMIARPKEIHDALAAAVARSKQNGNGVAGG